MHAQHLRWGSHRARCCLRPSIRTDMLKTATRLSFRRLSTASAASPAAALPLGKVSAAYESLTKNWGESVTLRPPGVRFAAPADLLELQEVVRSASSMRVVGSAHSFNDICVGDADGEAPTLLGTQLLGTVHDVEFHEGEDEAAMPRMTVRAGGGVTYGEIMRYLAPRQLALKNVPSLPQVTVAGSIATATHGSGLRLPNLAGDVAALQFVRADGETLRAVRDDYCDAGLYAADGDATAGDVPFDAAAISLGCLGVVSSVTLEVVPAYDVHQRVLHNVAVPALLADDGALLAQLLTEADSCSLFIDFSRDAVEVMWLRNVVACEDAPEVRAHDARDAGADKAYFDDPARCGFDPQPRPGTVAARLLAADARAALMREPVAFLESGMDVLTTRAGPWFEVLPFFVAPHTRPPRDSVMPNTALHSEFFVPLGPPGAPLLGPDGVPDISNAVAALHAVRPVAARWPGWGALGAAWAGVPERDARGALNAARDPQHSGVAVMSEIRVIRGDHFLMSPTNAGASTPEAAAAAAAAGGPGAFMAVHMTWGGADQHAAAVAAASRELEAALRPFGARPHWGKVFSAGHAHGAADADLGSIGELYAPGRRLERFKALCAAHDPGGKFRRAEWVRRVLGEFPNAG